MFSWYIVIIIIIIIIIIVCVTHLNNSFFYTLCEHFMRILIFVTLAHLNSCQLWLR